MNEDSDTVESYEEINRFLDSFQDTFSSIALPTGCAIAALSSQWLYPVFLRYAARAEVAPKAYSDVVDKVWSSLVSGECVLVEADSQMVSGLYIQTSEGHLPHYRASKPYVYQKGGENVQFCGEAATSVLAHTVNAIVRTDCVEVCHAVDKTLAVIVERFKHKVYSNPFDVGGREVTMEEFRRLNNGILYHNRLMVEFVRATLNALDYLQEHGVSAAARESLGRAFPPALD